MSRTRTLVLTPLLLLAAASVPAARAEEAAKEPAKEAAKAAGPVDPRLDALVKEAVEKAKLELREEIRVELQGAQAAAQFAATTAEGPKFQHLELGGYFRVRGDLFDDFDLKRGLDTNGLHVFQQTIFNPDGRGTLATTNMRLRLEPTINASESLRVRTQIDVLDDYVFGSAVGGNWSGAPVTASAATSLQSGYLTDRPVVNVKRIWGEVDTPFGLLAFGRMPSVWGVGIMAPAADGLDDDYGDSKDRLQFATLPIQTPLGPLTFIPSITFDMEGTLSADPHLGRGVGQPFDRDSFDDGRTYGLKVVRIDTEQEARRKLERGEGSMEYGALYEYTTLPRVNLAWLQGGFAAPQSAVGDGSPSVNSSPWIDRREYRHTFDLFYRYRTSRLRFETEAAGVIGQIGDPGPYAWTLASDGTVSSSVPYIGPRVNLQQFGWVGRLAYDVAPGKVNLGLEAAFASGDPAPGFGNSPGTLSPTAVDRLPTYGALEGPQYGINGDHAITNFRFNPGYRVDMILWRELLGNVTDAWYMKPSMKWDIAGGLAFDAAVIYSQAIYGSSTPDSTGRHSGSLPLGIELDTKLSYASDDGLRAWFSWGMLQPLNAFGGGNSLTRAHALRAGVAIKF
jgi:uncharacterized protein (TIGR04551 family)